MRGGERHGLGRAQGSGELVDGLEEVQLRLGPQPVGTGPALDGGVQDEAAGGDVPGTERGEDRAQGVVDGQDMGEAAPVASGRTVFPASPSCGSRSRKALRSPVYEAL